MIKKIKDTLESINDSRGNVNYLTALYKSIKMFSRFNIKEFLNYITNLGSKHDIKFTFFLVGKIFQNKQEIIDRLKENDHEIASHSMNHLSAKDLSFERFDKEIKDSIKVLGNVNGYRPPNLVYDYKYNKILEENGIKYVSSKLENKVPYKISDKLYEVPVSFMDYSHLLGKRNDNEFLKLLLKTYGKCKTHIYHPYGFASLRYRNLLDSFLRKVDLEKISITEMLKKKEGFCMTIDIGEIGFSEMIKSSFHFL